MERLQEQGMVVCSEPAALWSECDVLYITHIGDTQFSHHERSSDTLVASLPIHKKVYNLKAVHFICLGFGGRAVTALILRGFRLSGRFLLHVLSNGVSLASRIARARR